MFTKTLVFALFLIYLMLHLAILVKINLTLKSLVITDRTTDLLDLDLLRFKKYVKDFKKKYSSQQEYNNRYNNFKDSLLEIAKLNAIEKNNVFGLTKFSDMTAQEFAERMKMANKKNCYNVLESTCSPTNKKPATPYKLTDKISSRIDWRENGIVGPVMDQKRCGGCWAFSITGVMESMAKKYYLITELLSIQEILDCIPGDGSGCNGFSVLETLRTLCYFHWGVVSEKSYPLTLRSERCQQNLTQGTGIKLKQYSHRCNVSDEYLQRAIMKGPIVAVVNAAIWRNYLGGIIQRACVRSDDSVNHAVQVVGYDTTGDIPYYLIRNSWGEDFGEHGYVRIRMFRNMCGISEDVSVIDVK